MSHSTQQDEPRPKRLRTQTVFFDLCSTTRPECTSPRPDKPGTVSSSSSKSAESQSDSAESESEREMVFIDAVETPSEQDIKQPPSEPDAAEEPTEPDSDEPAEATTESSIAPPGGDQRRITRRQHAVTSRICPGSREALNREKLARSSQPKRRRFGTTCPRGLYYNFASIRLQHDEKNRERIQTALKRKAEIKVNCVNESQVYRQIG